MQDYAASTATDTCLRRFALRYNGDRGEGVVRRTFKLLVLTAMLALPACVPECVTVRRVASVDTTGDTVHVREHYTTYCTR